MESSVQHRALKHTRTSHREKSENLMIHIGNATTHNVVLLPTFSTVSLLGVHWCASQIEDDTDTALGNYNVFDGDKTLNYLRSIQ